MQNHIAQQPKGQIAPRVPAVERIGVMGQQMRTVLFGLRVMHDHRGGKIAQDREYRALWQVGKVKTLFLLGQQ